MESVDEKQLEAEPELIEAENDADGYYPADDYRALSTPAVASLALGILSALALLDWMLLLIPVAILAALIVSLVGFTGIAFHLGRLIETRFEQVRNRPYLATIAGIALIVSPVLLARVVGLIPGLGILSAILVVAGVVLEYIAWTAGLGAAVLSRFGRPQPVPAAPTAPPPALATQ